MRKFRPTGNNFKIVNLIVIFIKIELPKFNFLIWSKAAKKDISDKLLPAISILLIFLLYLYVPAYFYISFTNC